MPYYNRIDVSEDIGVHETSASKDCIICQNWYFNWVSAMGAMMYGWYLWTLTLFQMSTVLIFVVLLTILANLKS